MTECLEGNGLVAYKNNMQGVVTNQKVPKAILTKSTLIDNGIGMNMNIKGPDYSDLRMEFNHNKIYGSSPVNDDSQRIRCGFMSAVFNGGGVVIHVTSNKIKPFHNLMGGGHWGGFTFLKGNEFINFRSKLTSSG